MHYCLYGLQVESDLPLPVDALAVTQQAIHRAIPEPPADLRIKLEAGGMQEFPRAQLLARRSAGCAYHVGDGILIAAFNGIKMHFNGDGSLIRVACDLNSPTHLAMVGAWLINLGLSVCSLLRGDLPLHGAAAEIDNKLFNVMATSGTGKSTLLWRLLDAGALFGADDMLPVRFTSHGAVATPALALPAKLSASALRARGFNPLDFSEVAPSTNEFWVPIEPARRARQSRMPAALIVLRPHLAQAAQRVAVQRHQGGAAVALLMENTQGLWAACGFLNASEIFKRYRALATAVPIYSVHYYRSLETLPQLVGAITHLVITAPQAPVLQQSGMASSAKRSRFWKRPPQPSGSRTELMAWHFG